MTGIAFIICGPSGVGKATVIHRLLELLPDLLLTKSYTTRAIRSDDDLLGKYTHLGREEFEARIERGEFLEWAEVHGYLYGTPRAEFERAANTERDLLVELDYQGAAQVRQVLEDCVGIFLAPPDMDVLRARLEGRSSVLSEREVEVRMTTAEEELRHRQEFDYVVVNDTIDGAVEEVRCIVVAERARTHRVLRRQQVTADG